MASDSPKILVFIDWFKPAYKAGGPIQSVYNLTAALAGEMEFYICTGNQDLGESEPLNVTSDEWVEFEKGIMVIYLSEANRTKNTIKSIIHSQEFDAIYMNSVFSFYYTIIPLWLTKNLSAKRIVASRGMLAKGALALKKSKKTVFLTIAKLTGLYSKVTWHVSAAHEAADVKHIFGTHAITKIAPNLPNKKDIGLAVKEKKEKELDLFSVARVAEVKNLLFALQCLKHEYDGNIRFYIYGPLEEIDYWQKCQEVIHSLPENITVTYHGQLKPEEIHNTINVHDFLFLPTFNENYGHVIIESFLASKPVIISNKTPWKHLANLKVGWELSLDETLSWREHITHCLNMKNEEYKTLSESAYNYGKLVLNRTEDLENNRSLFLS